MSISCSDLWHAKRWVVGCLAIWLCVGFCSACSGAEGTLQVRTADGAEVGKTLQGEGWAVTLVDQPELTKQVGSGTAVERTDMGEDGTGQTGMREAEGLWLILAVEVTNDTGDLAMLARKVLKVTDGEGSEYQRAGVGEAVGPLIWADDRWEGQKENQLADNVFDVGQTREGPLVFDVPEDAGGFTLVMEGTEEVISLGF